MQETMTVRHPQTIKVSQPATQQQSKRDRHWNRDDQRSASADRKGKSTSHTAGRVRETDSAMIKVRHPQTGKVSQAATQQQSKRDRQCKRR